MELNFKDWLFNERALEPPPAIKDLLSRVIDTYYSQNKDELQKPLAMRDLNKLEKVYNVYYTSQLDDPRLQSFAEPIKIHFTSKLPQNANGQYSPNSQKIFINNNISTANDIIRKKSTLNHEFVHHIQNLQSQAASQKTNQNVQAGLGPKQATKQIKNVNPNDPYQKYLLDPRELHPWINNTVNSYRSSIINHAIKNKVNFKYEDNPKMFVPVLMKQINDTQYRKTLFNNSLKDPKNQKKLSFLSTTKQYNLKLYNYILKNLYTNVVEKDYTSQELQQIVNAQKMAERKKQDPEQIKTNNIINKIKQITPPMAQKYLNGSSVITSNRDLQPITRELNSIMRDKNTRNNQQIMQTLQSIAQG